MSAMDAELARLNAILETHTEQDELNFQEMKASIVLLHGKVDELRLARASAEGERAAVRRMSATVSGVVSVIASLLINYAIKHVN